MASNFDFLTDNWDFLLEDAKRVEAFALRDPRTAAFYARRTLELALQWLFDNDTALKAPYEKSLAAMIHDPTFKSNIQQGLFTDIRTIHRLGNLAAHSNQAISSQEGMQICGSVHRFTGWLARVYTKGGATPDPFNIAWLPKAEKPTEENKQQAQQNVIELQKVRKQLAKKDEADRTTKAKQEQTEAELQQLKEQLALLQEQKQENLKSIGPEEYTEAETRDLFIDVMLREAGWDPKAKNAGEYEVQGMPSNSGVGFVDYVLWGTDGKPLAVVEAKKSKVDPKVGKRQAELYADCLEQMTGQRPVIFYTNGYTTWLWDDRVYPPREVEGFYNQEELQWLINRRPGAGNAREDLSQLQPKTEITGRYYQMEAAARVMDCFGKQLRRKSLIVMATGSGKTRLAIALVDMLMRGNWARRVLFLADRRALVRQAKREFNKHLPHVSVASLLEKTEEDARVWFSTYPTMLNLIDGTKKDQTDKYSVGHFDLVIIDEAHRSVYQKYGAIFDYFDSLLLGLTATPRGEVDRNTYRLFELADHQPTYSYELSQAVEDEFLVPPRALSVPLKFQREGIKYNELSPEEQEEYELQEQFHDEDTGELKQEIGSEALNKWLFNTDTVNKVLMHLMEQGIKVEGGDKLGKTIIFAKNSKHANFIVEQFDKNYPHLAGHFCRKVDYSVNYAQSLIDEFSIKNKDPQIVVSVDMMDTGIDVPEVVNLVFFKLVRSRTKFWQMIGRGTRLCPDLFGPNQDKSEFFIFDYCQNLEFFEANPEGYEAKTQESVKQKIFKRRLELAVVLQQGQPKDDDLKTFIEQLKDQLHSVVSVMNVDNFIIRKQREHVEYFNYRSNWAQLTEEQVNVINERLSGLPSPDEDNEDARRFDLLILNLQVSILQNLRTSERYQIAVMDIARNLEEKSAIPQVNAQMELIQEIQTDTFWQEASLSILEDVRKKLRNLVRFVETYAKEDVYTDFEDVLSESEAREFEIVQSDPRLRDYRNRVKRFIHEHQDHITIRRLKNNEPVSQQDIQALEDILFSEEGPIPRNEYEKIYGERPLGYLVRSITGLSRQAAKQAFADFMGQAPLHPDQISFLDEVVEYLIHNGTMEPKIMFEIPFTHFHDKGVVGIFGDGKAREVVEVVEHINHNADVA